MPEQLTTRLLGAVGAAVTGVDVDVAAADSQRSTRTPAEFAEEVGAALPPRAIQIRAERAAAEALIAQAHRDGRVSQTEAAAALAAARSKCAGS